MSSNLRTDIGYKSIIHYGEQLCGDHVAIEKPTPDNLVVVLADGLSSGVKASILSTLTSTIISTMIAQGISLEDCVETIAKTLPIDQQKNVAYSTFTLVNIIGNERAEIIQYENPDLILLRRGKNYSYPRTELEIGGKKFLRTSLRLHEGDIFIMMSDGCPHASKNLSYNMKWTRDDIIEYMENLSHVGYSAKSLAAMLVDECDALYGYKPIDDATACVIQLLPTRRVNLSFGPPKDPADDNRLMEEFFTAPGKHIVSGGVTSKIAARYLKKDIKMTAKSEAPGIPPISEIDGVDLTTEGIVTMARVLEYANDHLGKDELYSQWGIGRDGASLIARMLFEDATDIYFYVGQAVNEGHQDGHGRYALSFTYKMDTINKLMKALLKMGKRVKLTYY